MIRASMKPMIVVALLATLIGCRAEETNEAANVVPDSKEAAEVSGAASSEPPAPAKQVLEAGPGELDPRVLYQVPLHGDEPQLGRDDALITIVEFGDFDCPFCKSRAPTMKELREKYGDDLRVIWKNYPLPSHRNARAAATAALEAQAQKGDAGFWRMHDKLLENQGTLHRDTLERLAKEMKLNMRKFRQALDGDKYAERLDRDYALGQKLHIPGTPSYFMNGRFMAGFPLQTWSFAIDRQIGQVRRIVERGIPRAQIYEHLTAQGKAAP